MSEQEELFMEALNQRGYLVIGTNTKYEMKTILPSLCGHINRIHHPFTVQAITDYEDAATQTDLWGLSRSNMTPYRFYYRVITD